jgi:hypothetical protein
MKILFIVLGIVLVIGLVLPAAFYVFGRFANPSIEQELIDDPQGERAQKVMLITLPSGRRIPVNYLREGDRVYAAADGRWWKELVGGGYTVRMLVRGERLVGTARAVVDDPAYTKEIFARLRPSAVPGFGTLIEIQLEAAAPEGAD